MVKPGPKPNPNALRRNPEHNRERLREWRARNPDRWEQQKKRNDATRADRYMANPAYYLWRTARSRAKANGQEFAITLEDVTVPTHCPITGDEISILSAASRNGASLDRVDNSLGYVRGNVRVISRRANRMKGDASIKDLERMIAYMKGEL
jgi:hypothetical protein